MSFIEFIEMKLSCPTLYIGSKYITGNYVEKLWKLTPILVKKTQTYFNVLQINGSNDFETICVRKLKSILTSSFLIDVYTVYQKKVCMSWDRVFPENKVYPTARIPLSLNTFFQYT